MDVAGVVKGRARKIHEILHAEYNTPARGRLGIQSHSPKWLDASRRFKNLITPFFSNGRTFALAEQNHFAKLLQPEKSLASHFVF